MLRLQFFGAADTVTGSRTAVSWNNRTWLVDCGLFQGDKAMRRRNWDPPPIPPKSLAGILLTHAHLDHSGYLPRLHREGFRGPIFSSPGTHALSEILLRDAAHLEEEAADYANRTGYSNHKPADPLFNVRDAEAVLTQFRPVQRDEWMVLDAGLSVRFLAAGHIVGASIVQLSVTTQAGPRLVTFSGDLGNDRQLVMRPPVHVDETDVLILEATYGDRLQPRSSALEALAAVANRTFSRGGVLVIPAFAVGRAQEVGYMLRTLMIERRVPTVPVILDSPMSSEALRVAGLYPEDLKVPADELSPPSIEITRSSDESMLACMRDGPLVIISASGMLSGGRILHHLRHRLPDARNTVVFTGYQAEGTKGRWLQDSGKETGTIRIHHTEVPIAAEIATLDHVSAHADYQDILTWLGFLRRAPERVFINHGAPDAQAALAAKIHETFAWRVERALDLWQAGAIQLY